MELQKWGHWWPGTIHHAGGRYHGTSIKFRGGLETEVMYHEHRIRAPGGKRPKIDAKKLWEETAGQQEEFAFVAKVEAKYDDLVAQGRRPKFKDVAGAMEALGWRASAAAMDAAWMKTGASISLSNALSKTDFVTICVVLSEAFDVGDSSSFELAVGAWVVSRWPEENSENYAYGSGEITGVDRKERGDGTFFVEGYYVTFDNETYEEGYCHYKVRSLIRLVAPPRPSGEADRATEREAAGARAGKQAEADRKRAQRELADATAARAEAERRRAEMSAQAELELAEADAARAETERLRAELARVHAAAELADAKAARELADAKAARAEAERLRAEMSAAVAAAPTTSPLAHVVNVELPPAPVYAPNGQPLAEVVAAEPASWWSRRPSWTRRPSRAPPPYPPPPAEAP